LSLAIWRLAWRALQLGRGYSENSALESAQEQPSHTVDQRKWTVTAAGLAAEFDNDNSLTDAWALFPSRAALRHATWLESLAFTHRRMSSSRSILVRTLETASSSDEARMSNECLRITGISERLGRTATRQARPTCSAFILYPRYSVWCSGIDVETLRRPHQSPNHACIKRIIGWRGGMEERGRQGKQSSNGGQHPSPKGQACFHRNAKCEVDHDDLPQLCLDRITEVEGTRS